MCRFLPLIFLPASYPGGSMQAPFFRAFHALAVDDGGAGGDFALRLLSAGRIKRMVDAVERAIPGPKVEIVMDRAPRRQILRDRSPLAAGREHIHQPVDHLAQVDAALAAARLARRDQRLDQRPFLVRQVARIPQVVAVVTGAVLDRPHRAPLFAIRCRTRNVWPAPSARVLLKVALASLHQRIRSQGHALAKMEIRAPSSS